jgi:NAD(P)H dehydrogenase (quinone)
MILVTGAGGKTGRVLIKILSKIESACGFVHREEQVSTLESLGAEKVFVGDLRDESAVRSAMQGAKAVYHICPNMSPDEVVIGTLVIGEAKRAGVGHFVYHSVLHPQTERMTHHWQKLRVEEMLFESGLPFTILQPAPYMQNLLAVWKSIVEKGELRVPYSIHAKFSFLDLEDLAEAARIVLMEPGHIHATYELAGTNPMSHAKVAEIFSHVLDRGVRAEKEEIGDWRLRAKQSAAQSKRSSSSDYAMENLVRMFEYYDRWGLAGNPNVLKWVLKREPTSLESFILKNV